MKAILLSLAVLLPSIPSHAMNVASVEFAPQLYIQGQQLSLDGAGLLRWKGIFKVYAAGLYREDITADFSLSSDETQVLEIEYLRSVPAKGFVKATELGLEKTLPAGESLADWDAQLQTFLAAYQAVEKGDRYRLSVTADEFSLSLNEVELYRSADTDLGRRLLGVWLDERSLSPSLRQDLLALN